MPAPIDPIKRQIWLKKLSLVHRGRTTWNKGIKMPTEFRLKMGKLSKGFWTNPMNKEKIILRNIKVGNSKKGDRNPMKRAEVVAKRSLKMIGKLVGDKNPAKNPDVRKKIQLKLLGHKVAENTRTKISKSLEGKMVGELNPFYGKHHTQANKVKSRTRAINMITSGLLSKRRTGIELKIGKALSESNLKFNEQYPLEGITVVDFYLPEYRVVIYCDGDYWHKGKWAEKHGVIRKDNWQNRVLEKGGYKVFRFSEIDINISPEKCVDLINYFILNNHEQHSQI